MNQVQSDFMDLLSLSRRIKTLQGVIDILHWDEETYMPKGASQIRAEQLKQLTGIIHKEKTSKKFEKALDQLIDLKTGKIKVKKGLSDPQKAALKEWHRGFVKNKALPSKFVSEFTKLTSQTFHVWEKCYKDDDFKTFLPLLEKVITMCRKKADYLGFDDHPYDALLDLFEPHMKKRDVDGLFAPFQKSTLSLLKKILSEKQVNDTFLHDLVPVEKQQQWNVDLLKILDFDLNKGRLDSSSHPFSLSPHPTDNRITTRIHPGCFFSNIRSILHEFGHALYEMNLPAQHYGSPLGEAISLGIHESQSRFFETFIGQSKPFWSYCFPKLKTHFKGKLEKVTLDAFWKAINKVQPSLIRVEADEVTYALHIFLRFDLEVKLIEGTLKAKDLPEAWNSKMEELLGIVPETFREGCLQDVHWSIGAFGYFPTYCLGNIFAAFFFNTFSKQHPEWKECLAQGDLQVVKRWLKETIHVHGKRYISDELLKNVAGKELSTLPLQTYLNHKYKEIYSF